MKNVNQVDPATTPGTDPIRTTASPLLGVRGWLAFYCTVLIVINPLATVYSFFSEHQSIELLRKLDQASRSAKVLEEFTLFWGVPSFALAVFGVVAGILLVRRCQNAVIVAKIHTAAVPTLSVLALVASFGFPGSPEMKGALIQGSVLGAIKSLGYFSIWFTYLCRSRRVQETYRDGLNYERPEAGTVVSDGQTVIPIAESLPLSPSLQETRDGKEKESGSLESHNQRVVPPSTDEEAFYEIVSTELEQQTHKTGIWTKAFADASGSPEQTRVLYIRYRVAQLVDARNREQEEHRYQEAQLADARSREQEEHHREEAKASRQRIAAGFRGVLFALLATFLGLLTLIAALLAIIMFVGVAVDPAAPKVPIIICGLVVVLISILLAFATKAFWKRRGECDEKTKREFSDEPLVIQPIIGGATISTTQDVPK